MSNEKRSTVQESKEQERVYEERLEQMRSEMVELLHFLTVVSFLMNVRSLKTSVSEIAKQKKQSLLKSSFLSCYDAIKKILPLQSSSHLRKSKREFTKRDWSR